MSIQEAQFSSSNEEKILQEFTVGLFGYYSHGNFGDNLMAIIFEKRLIQLGVRVVTFTRCNQLKQQIKDSTTDRIDQFLRLCNTVFIGGGGILVGNTQPSLKFNTDLKEIIDGCRILGKDIHGFSIGGEGLAYNDLCPSVRRELVDELKSVTLRNEEDQGLFAGKNTIVACFPDVVWATPDYFTPKKFAKGGLHRVGVCLRIAPGKRRMVIDFLFRALGSIFKRTEVIFLAVQESNLSDGSAVYNTKRNCAQSIKVLSNVKEACEVISGLDILVTNKLHVGIVAMSFGIPVLSLGAERKTSMVFKRLGLGRYCFGPRRLDRLFCLFSRKYAGGAGLFVKQELSSRLGNRARGHLEMLDKIVVHLCRGKA